MKDREIIILLNRIRDVVEGESDNERLTLNKTDVTILFYYLKSLKKQAEKSSDLIQKIQTEIYRFNEETLWSMKNILENI